MCRCGVALGGDKSLGIVKRINRAAGSWIYYTSKNAPGELTKAPEDSPKAQSDAQLKRTQIQAWFLRLGSHTNHTGVESRQQPDAI
jgi:hypothetical protein